jgi:hypothetical protein
LAEEKTAVGQDASNALIGIVDPRPSTRNGSQPFFSCKCQML